MKMNSRQKYNAPTQDISRKMLVLFFFVLFLGGIAVLFQQNVLSGISLTLVEPLGSDFLKLLKSKRVLVLEHRGLEEKVTELTARGLLVDQLEKENIELKGILGRRDSSRALLGVVLARPTVSPYDTLIVDIGEREGVNRGDKVRAYGSIVIGEVEEVYRSASLIKLFSAPGVKSSVIVGATNILIQAKGRGGGNFIIELPRDVEVQIGDSILLPNIRMQLLGTVEYIEKAPSEPFQTIYFKSTINMGELRFVEILLNT
jgi:cell shape-determining protein MreC